MTLPANIHYKPPIARELRLARPIMYAFTMPAGYTQIQDTLYPDAATYVGNAQVGVFAFTAPLTIIPGVDWIVQHMIDACVSATKQLGTKMLELQVYSKPASLGSSDYIVSICVEDTAAVSYKRVVGLAPLTYCGHYCRNYINHRNCGHYCYSLRSQTKMGRHG